MATPRALPSRRQSASWSVCRRILAILSAVFLGSLTCEAAAAKSEGTASEWAVNFKQKVLQDAVTTLLDHQLPLKLDANNLYPSVATLPGGPFRPEWLKVAPEDMQTPLPPGDYVIRAVAFCSEYSVHRPGAGVAYQVGPLQGKAANAIAALLWRGTIDKGRRTRELQKVSWAIQSGLTYLKMPKTYQAVIDDIIPDYRSSLGGDFVQNLEDLYTSRAKDVGLPPLNTLLGRLGKPGDLVISANRQRAALLKKTTNDQLKDQVLFAGQERRIAAVKPSEGPWTVKIPGVAYVRYRVVGGSQRTNNEIQLRILPQPATAAVEVDPTRTAFGSLAPAPMRIAAAATPPKNRGTSPYDLINDGIGYSAGRAAQILYFVPLPTPKPPDNADGIGRVIALKGTVNVTRNGQTRPLTSTDQVQMNDIISTGQDSGTTIDFDDGSQFTLNPGAKLQIDEFVYNPADAEANRERYTWLGGTFRYVSGLIGKNDSEESRNISSPAGGIGIRGTEFVASYIAETETVEIKLITGSLMLSPALTSTSTLVKGPVSVQFTKSDVKTQPLARKDYDHIKPVILVR